MPSNRRAIRGPRRQPWGGKTGIKGGSLTSVSKRASDTTEGSRNVETGASALPTKIKCG